MKTVIYNADIVTSGAIFRGYVVIEGDKISQVVKGDFNQPESQDIENIINAEGRYLMPGIIDEHVHFRDPGLTAKADILTESLAAAAGGVTSYFDMPNCKPATVTLRDIENKYARARKASAVNYSFYIGATNDNFDEIRNADFSKVCGIKLFLGSSTGGMLVNEGSTIDTLLRFSRDTGVVVAVHSEDEDIIRANAAKYRDIYGDDVPLRFHPEIRSEEACYAATARIVEAATRIGARLHVMHISTARELELFNAGTPCDKKNITAEACIAHLMFADSDYDTLGSRIKCNPAIKKASDREALRAALTSGKIDAVATDHAPHLLCDKEGGCLKAASGMPMVQFSLPMMMDLAEAGILNISQVSNLMSHAPAAIFGVEARGDIKEGYYADLTLVERLNEPKTIQDSMVVSRCGWTPLHGISTNYRVVATMVNGNFAYNGGVFAPVTCSYAKPISFKH